MTLEDVLGLLKTINGSRCRQLHLQIGDFKLIIKKRHDNSLPFLRGNELSKEHEVTVPLAKSVEPAMVVRSTTVPSGKESDAASPDLFAIKAPMVGTFRRALTPDGRPIVEAGMLVDENDAVCAIEVLRRMNPIKAQRKGRVVEICATDGEMVEYGQPLILIETTAE